MPLNGFKRDEEATRKAGFLDPDSYVTLPKFGEPHLILGPADKELWRRALFAREKSLCQRCGRRVYWDGPIWERGEWSHIEDSVGKKCDCLHNAELLCHDCHQGPGSRHFKRRPRWTKQEAAKG